jgi:hypothetical protein
MKSKVSPAIFFAAVVCFLLPFITVSCGTQKVGRFSGLQIADGTSLDRPEVLGRAPKEKVDVEVMATIAGLCALGGLLLSFVRGQTLIPAMVSAVGAMSLFLMKARLDQRVAQQGQGMLQVNYEVGYWLEILLLIAGTAWNAYRYIQPGELLPASAPVLPAPGKHPVPSTVGRPGIFCPACGALSSAGRLCNSCGAPLTSAS